MTVAKMESRTYYSSILLKKKHKKTVESEYIQIIGNGYKKKKKEKEILK